MKICKNCGQEIDDKAVVCVKCGASAKVKKPIFKKWWFWALIVFVTIAIIAASSSSEDAKTNNNVDSNSTTSNAEQSNSTGESQKPSIPEEFAGDFPLEVSASIADNVIGMPELTCNIKNNTDKEIAAVQLYFIPVDVYGEEVNTIFTTNKLYTDKGISAYSSYTSSWSLLDDEIKSGDLYVYSVYYTDGTEWGDKDSSVSRIKKYGYKYRAEN